MADKTHTERAAALLKPHSFRYRDRAAGERLGISAVEATGVEYWPSVKIVAALLADADGRAPERDTAVCSDHKPVQHRDAKPPWCKKCGLTAELTEPVSRLNRG